MSKYAALFCSLALLIFIPLELGWHWASKVLPLPAVPPGWKSSERVGFRPLNEWLEHETEESVAVVGHPDETISDVGLWRIVRRVEPPKHHRAVKVTFQEIGNYKMTIDYQAR